MNPHITNFVLLLIVGLPEKSSLYKCHNNRAYNPNTLKIFSNCDIMDELNRIFDCFTHLSGNKSFTRGNNIVLLVNLAFFKIFVARQKIGVVTEQ